jgi:hypothetical protein
MTPEDRPDDRFGDLGPEPLPNPEGRSAAERLEEEDRLRPEPDMPPPQRPEVPRTGNKYAWVVGIVMLMGIGVLLLTTALPNTGAGLRGPPRGETLPDFAAPLALSDSEGDANVRQTGGGGSDSAGSQPACAIRGDGIYNVCDDRESALVLTFLVTEGADCEPQVDRVERMRAEFPDVEFAAVVSGADREDIEQIVRRREWDLPVAVDRDGAVVNLYGVGVCPSTVFAHAGGDVRTTKLGNLTEDQLRAQVERLRR